MLLRIKILFSNTSLAIAIARVVRPKPVQSRFRLVVDSLFT